MSRRGFFKPGEVTAQRASLSVIREPGCAACGLYKGCLTPKMPVHGSGKRKILVVGEAPGENEDYQGRPFVGKSGQLLQQALSRAGVGLFQDCWVTNALRCFTGDVRVEASSPTFRAYRRHYTGLLVRVTTAGGRVFTGTPNHPILTVGGWVALGLLEEGDDLVCRPRGQGVGSSRPDVDDPPPAFEQVFGAIAELGDVRRVVGGRDDFHGDGEDGDVDVVRAGGLLWDRIQAALDEPTGERPLVPADEGGVDFLRDGGAGGSGSDLFGSLLPPAGGIMGGGGDCCPPVGAKQSETLAQGIAAIADGNTCPDENPPEPVGTARSAPDDGLSTLAGLVTTDRIVKVERKRCDEAFDGDDAPYGPTHVYNLETGDGFYYIADGIVASNCRPRRNKLPKDPKQLIEHCRPYLLRAVKELGPEVIILLGGVPVYSLIGWLWKEDSKGTMRWAGWQIPSARLNAWVCPTFHPSFILRGQKGRGADVAEALFNAHLEAACSLRGRPYDPAPPDLAKCVRCVHDPERAADHVHRYIDAGRPVAFDYETDRLKPDHPDARIVCCGVSDGATSVSFPWHGAARKAVKELLLSDVPKVGWNCKFEEKWTRRDLGVRVNNWALDGMLAAHVVDNRQGTKSLKFQAFARLGQDSYDDHIKPYLSAETGNDRNRVAELSLDKLLHYCGLDALLEAKLGQLLAPQVGVEL